MIKFVSYNCNSVRKNAETVINLLNKADVVFLQELMLSKSDLPVLHDFHSDFDHAAYVKDCESQGINEGRPSSGVAIFWRKHLTSLITPLIIDDSLIGAIFRDNDNVNNNILFLNVYLPCDTQTADAFDKYRNSLAKLEVIIQEQSVNNVVIVGDFNADPVKGRFWKELCSFSHSFSLVFLDEQLPRDTFTYLCPAKDSTSWLDHTFCTKYIASRIRNVYVDYKASIYDHFPLHFECELYVQHTTYKQKQYSSERMVRWHQLSEKDKSMIKMKIEHLIRKSELLEHDIFHCSTVKCKDKQHLKYIDSILQDLTDILLCSTGEYSFSNDKLHKIIPGWNEFLRGLHADARTNFLNWLREGKPLDGAYREIMRTSRAKFKKALDKCKKDEENIRNKRLTENLKKKNYKEFWNDVHKSKTNKNIIPTIIDSENNENFIARNFAKKYNAILDKENSKISSANSVDVELSGIRIGQLINLFTVNDIHEAIKCLKPSIGYDNIHSNHLIFAPDCLAQILAKLFSSCVIHEYLPPDIIYGIINPVIKDIYGDISDSDNYRPVMSSSVFLKLFEYCILKKVSGYFKSNDRQHGFRTKYSTVTACLSLKETVFNYIKSNTSVYACFIDISKAFDSVDHKILIEKLIDINIPIYFVGLIKYWYCNQRVSVRFGNEISESFIICNGVRQGGVLSGLLFNLYIDCVLDKLSSMKVGCRMGIVNSNVIAYADDIVLLAPSAAGLQMLMNKASQVALGLKLNFNKEKTKCMIFSKSRPKTEIKRKFIIENEDIQFVRTITYLGFILQNNLNDSEDIYRMLHKFYKDFNCILRKFSFTDKEVLLYLFKQYCLQFYGSELWIGNRWSSGALKQFGIGYHKAIKKIIKVSYHESNHYACQEAHLFTFEHLVNKIKISTAYRLITNPCDFFIKVKDFMKFSSALFRDVHELLQEKYGVDSLIDNDCEALIARITFIQNHKEQMRGPWFVEENSLPVY